MYKRQLPGSGLPGAEGVGLARDLLLAKDLALRAQRAEGRAAGILERAAAARRDAEGTGGAGMRVDRAGVGDAAGLSGVMQIA